MARKLSGGRRERGGVYYGSLPVRRGSKERVERAFADETSRERWLAAGISALAAGRALPESSSFDERACKVPGPTHSRRRVGFAEAAHHWWHETYEDLRRAQPERANRVRSIIEQHLVPYVAPRVSSLDDIDKAMVVGLLKHLAGRGATAQTGAATTGGIVGNRDLTIPEAAQLCGCSTSTIRRAWAADTLPHARRDPDTRRILIPAGDLRAAGLMYDASPQADGLSKQYASDVLWVLRQVLGHAQANGWMESRDPTHGLSALEPDPADARVRPDREKPRPLTLLECRLVCSHLHVVYQLAFWLQRILGLRIGETYGLRVGDLIDLGDHGLLVVGRQGGRAFLVRDEHGVVTTSDSKEDVKTAASHRVIVVPRAMMDMIRVAVVAFHTDPDNGEVDLEARLIPGLQGKDRAGQLGFRQRLEYALRAEGLDADNLGFRVTPHALRKALTTDLAWSSDLDDVAMRRWVGHAAGTDVYGRVYTLDHPDLARLLPIAEKLDADIADGLGGTLVVATTARPQFGTGNPLRARMAYIDAVLAEAGWAVDPTDGPDPLCDTARVAVELGVAETTARRWMREGLLPSVCRAERGGEPRRCARLSDVHALAGRLANQIRLADACEQLSLGYNEAWRTLQKLGIHPGREGRDLLLDAEQVEALRAERDRVADLHRRAVKITTASVMIGRAGTTVRALIGRGELIVDAETDSSGARFITRESIAALLGARDATATAPAGTGDACGVVSAVLPVAEVSALTGLTRRALTDLVRGGYLLRSPDRQGGITAESVRRWAAGYRPDLLDRLGLAS